MLHPNDFKFAHRTQHSREEHNNNIWLAHWKYLYCIRCRTQNTAHIPGSHTLASILPHAMLHTKTNTANICEQTHAQMVRGENIAVRIMLGRLGFWGCGRGGSAWGQQSVSDLVSGYIFFLFSYSTNGNPYTTQLCMYYSEEHAKNIMRTSVFNKYYTRDTCVMRFLCVDFNEIVMPQTQCNTFSDKWVADL